MENVKGSKVVANHVYIILSAGIFFGERSAWDEPLWRYTLYIYSDVAKVT
jgi:hypothetical protein